MKTANGRLRFALLLMGVCSLIACAGGSGGSSAGGGAVVPLVLPSASPYALVLEDFDLVVASGARLYGQIRRPDPAMYPPLRFPTVIVIPGGINPGRVDAGSPDATLLAETGMVVVCYNAEGRVSTVPGDLQSEGTEDFNGHRNQDNLAEIAQFVLARSYVDSGNLGFASFSFGVTTCSGCLARHPDLPVQYFVDGEGPSESYVTCHEPRALDGDATNDKHDDVLAVLGHYSTARDPSQANADFWAEREAVHFIGAFRGRYLRLQAYWDHIQAPLTPADFNDFEQPPLWWHAKHTTDMANAAVAGGVPWVRVNSAGFGNPINAVYDFTLRPAFVPDVLKGAGTPWFAIAINEMARLQALNPVRR